MEKGKVGNKKNFLLLVINVSFRSDINLFIP